jgi:hypothetical protein
MTTCFTPAPARIDLRRVSRDEIVDAASRVITRRSDHRVWWAAVACEAGSADALTASQWFEDL